MPIPLIVAGAGLMTLGGLAAVTQEASKIGFPSSSGSSDDEWGDNISYGDKIREYESIAIGGELGDEDPDDKRRGSQGAAAGAVAGDRRRLARGASRLRTRRASGKAGALQPDRRGLSRRPSSRGDVAGAHDLPHRARAHAFCRRACPCKPPNPRRSH